MDPIGISRTSISNNIILVTISFGPDQEKRKFSNLGPDQGQQIFENLDQSVLWYLVLVIWTPKIILDLEFLEIWTFTFFWVFFMKFGQLKWSCSWSIWILNWNNWSNKVSELKKDFQDLSKNYRKYYPSFSKWWVINNDSESILIYCDGLHGDRQTWTWTRGSLTLPRTSKGLKV